MRSLLAVLALSAATLVGCGSACRDLANRICSCQPAGQERDLCLNTVKGQVNVSSPSDADEKFCQATLKTCPDPSQDQSVCNALHTQAGKVACGLAFAPGT